MCSIIVVLVSSKSMIFLCLVGRRYHSQLLGRLHTAYSQFISGEKLASRSSNFSDK